MWNLIYGTNELIYRKETTLMDVENRLVTAKGRGGGGGGGGGRGGGPLGLAAAKRLHLE